MPLLGAPGDSPIVPVQVDEQQRAMFFSPGFVPLLFRENGTASFRKFRRVDLRQQDGEEFPAFTTAAHNLSVGNLTPATLEGYLLPETDDRVVDGRAIVGMLGRDVLSNDAVVDLDMPGRRLTITSPHGDCRNVRPPPPAGSIDMQQEVLLAPVAINGQAVEAVLEPDLPVSILPKQFANRIGIGDAEMANDPSVVTKFGKGVLGRRHRIDVLAVGDSRLEQVAFDVEDGVAYPMLGLNFFGFGQATFDFANRKFRFRKTGTILPPPSDLHFDTTRVAHVGVRE